MIFDGYTKDNTGTYMVLIDNDKVVLINLLNIEYVQEFATNRKILKTKDGKEYFFYDNKKIESTRLPEGFKWNKRIYKSPKWYDTKRGWKGYDVTLVNKLEVLLSNPEKLLNKQKKACEDAEV